MKGDRTDKEEYGSRDIEIFLISIGEIINIKHIFLPLNTIFLSA